MLIWGDIAVSLDSLPNDLIVRNSEEPAVVQTNSGAGVTTEDEHVLLGGRDGSMLSSRNRVLLTFCLLPLPSAVL